VAELGGPPAVSALVVLLNLLLIEGFLCLRPPARRPTRAFLSAAAVVAVVLVLGMLRSAQVAAWRQSATILKTAIVHLDQGPLSISERQSASERLLSTLRKLNDAAGAAGASFIVWPESAFPHLFDRALDREYPREHPWHLARPDPGSRLLFGALSHDFGDDHVQNSAVLVSEQGAVVGIYDKQHLLAFGEYIPFSDRFPAWAARLRTHMPEFPPIAAGAARPPLVDADLRLGVFICYEELVPSLALVHARQGVNLLVTLANHVWLAGSEAARARAAALASFRAIETRRDLVRATNAGQTTFVDALGRAQGLASPASHHPEDSALLVVDAALIEETAIGPYTIPVFPFFCAALLLVAAVSARRRRPSP
jgi:apolipoprotein N-acyltransferase